MIAPHKYLDLNLSILNLGGLILNLIKDFEIKGIAHITGGGFIENIPRMIPQNLAVKINLGTWPVFPIFKLLQQMGGFDDKQAYNTFNMGIGMVMAVNENDAAAVLKAIIDMGEKAYVIGKVEKGEHGVELC